MLISASREHKGLLSTGERKSIQTDRVILVPGPDHEVHCVHEIFRMFTDERIWPSAIASELRARGIRYSGRKRMQWYALAVTRLLKNPNYCGCSVFGHYTKRLDTRKIVNPRNLWTVTKGAWQPIIDEDTFNRAQARFEDRTIYKSDAELLARLRRLLEEQGKVSIRLLNDADYLPSVGPYVRRFGSVSEAAEKIGYIGQKLAATRSKRFGRTLRDQIIAQVVATDPNRITVTQRDGHFRPRLRVSGLMVSVLLCRCRQVSGRNRWVLHRIPREQHCIALLIFMNPENNALMDLFVVSDTESRPRYTLSIDDPWLQRAKKLGSVADFPEAVRLFNVQRKIDRKRQK